MRDARQDRRADLSRQFIAVLEPLLESGERYADVSVERLISAVDISRSTFYVYFEDKGDLLGALAEGIVGDLSASGRGWWSFPLHGSRRDLRGCLRPPIDVYRVHMAILRSVIEAAAYDERVRRQHVRLIDDTSRRLAAHIVKCQRQGRAAPRLDPRRTAEWLVWMFERGLYQLFSPASDDDAAALLDALTEIVWRTLYEGFRD